MRNDGNQIETWASIGDNIKIDIQGKQCEDV
jgi:hypothetical protein